jgi:hypothetical protein
VGETRPRRLKGGAVEVIFAKVPPFLPPDSAVDFA